MTCISAVGVYDDLTSGQSAVSVRSADHETSGRIYKEFGVLIYQFLWQDHIKYMFFDVFVDLFLCYVRIMLRRQNNCIQSCRFSVFIIFYGNLSFSVRS